MVVLSACREQPLDRHLRSHEEYSIDGDRKHNYEEPTHFRLGAIGNSLSSPSARRIVSFWYRRSFRSLQRQKCGVWKFRRFHTLHGQGKFFCACIGDSVPCLGCNCFGIVIWYRLGPWRLASLDSPR